MNRGRPPGKMTRRRQQVLQAYSERVEMGERISLAELARRCHLCDYREASRIVRDLKRMGQMA